MVIVYCIVYRISVIDHRLWVMGAQQFLFLGYQLSVFPGEKLHKPKPTLDQVNGQKCHGDL